MEVKYSPPPRGNSSERKQKVKKMVYASKGGACPFDPETMEAKHWERCKQHYWIMESVFEDLAQAYGEFRPDRM